MFEIVQSLKNALSESNNNLKKEMPDLEDVSIEPMACGLTTNISFCRDKLNDKNGTDWLTPKRTATPSTPASVADFRHVNMWDVLPHEVVDAPTNTPLFRGTTAWNVEPFLDQSYCDPLTTTTPQNSKFVGLGKSNIILN